MIRLPPRGPRTNAPKCASGKPSQNAPHIFFLKRREAKPKPRRNRKGALCHSARVRGGVCGGGAVAGEGEGVLPPLPLPLTPLPSPHTRVTRGRAGQQLAWEGLRPAAARARSPRGSAGASAGRAPGRAQRERGGAGRPMSARTCAPARAARAPARRGAVRGRLSRRRAPPRTRASRGSDGGGEDDDGVDETVRFDPLTGFVEDDDEVRSSSPARARTRARSKASVVNSCSDTPPRLRKGCRL